MEVEQNGNRYISVCAGLSKEDVLLPQLAALNNSFSIGDGAIAIVASAWAGGSNTVIPVTFVHSGDERFSHTNGDVMNRYSGEDSLLKT